jgi:hypothetical protein
MRRGASSTLGDREAALTVAERQLEAEVARLRRDEEYLALQVRQAREQVRYYEGLLTLLRRDWGKAPPIEDLVRKLS